MELSEQIINIAIDSLKDSPIIQNLKKDIEALLKYQEALYVYVSNPDETEINTLRIGTILVFSVIGKIIDGKDLKSFEKSDWQDILDNVAEYGVMIDQQIYTEFLFELFARYIELSIDINEESVKGKAAEDIRGIVDEIRGMSQRLENGDMKEADYVDRCLWSSFEAMIKLLAVYKTKKMCPEYSLFIQAVADFSVQYGRLTLYKKELALLDDYLNKQEVLDEELDARYNAYLNELQGEAEIFEDLMNNAFSDDFEQRLKNSVSLARKAGVSEDKILDTREKIDSFFMD
jgi:hypothetical protein